MKIQHDDNGEKGRFFVAEEDNTISAEMTYVYAGKEKFIIDHTEVSEVHKGKGVGAQLVKAAVEMARELGLKIIPSCPFAKRVFEKTPDYADVLA